MASKSSAVATNRIKGIDVSHYQGRNINWDKVKAAGYTFVIMKATDGLGKDSTYKNNRQGAADAGLIVGAYHFFRPKRPVRAQIDNFLTITGGVRKGELAPTGDFEQADLWVGLSKKAAADKAIEWLSEVEKATGMNPFYYSNFAFPKEAMGADARLKNYPLWLARYRKQEAVAPAPWTAWTIWQQSDTGVVPGITDNKVDLNVFFSSRMSTLLKFTKQ